MGFFRRKKSEKVPNQDSQNSSKSTYTSGDQQNTDPDLTEDLNSNLEQIKKKFLYPKNNALKIRELYLPSYHRQAVVLHIEAAVKTDVIDSHIVEPLMNANLAFHQKNNFASFVMQSILTAAETKEVSKLEDIVKELVNGNTVVLFDKEKTTISIDTIGFENRSVSEPTTETVIYGPKAAFIESASANRSLIRKQLRHPGLITETINVGKTFTQPISLMYLDGIADEKLIKTIREKLKKINAESITQLSQIDQYIEERSYSLFPSTLVTERPDRAAAFLLEGHVVLIMDNSPSALIAPITFWSLFHTVEDQYLRTPYGNFLRAIRFIALLITLLLPGIYVSIMTFHPEMIPTDLLLAIAATREQIPFPVVLEMLLMATVFEILREAGVRIPNTLGPTIGIVGALILGQAAVQANIISPILIVVISITGLASFTIQDVSLNIGVRLLGFLYIIIGSMFGFYGIALMSAMLLAYLISFTSFGLPFFAPLTPHYRSSKDLLARPPLWKQWIRPLSLSPKKNIRAQQPGGNDET